MIKNTVVLITCIILAYIFYILSSTFLEHSFSIAYCGGAITILINVLIMKLFDKKEE